MVKTPRVVNSRVCMITVTIQKVIFFDNNHFLKFNYISLNIYEAHPILNDTFILQII